MIVFAVQNVIKDPPFSKMDLVSCRNLLIYMDSELQKKVLPLFHYTSKSGWNSLFRHFREHRRIYRLFSIPLTENGKSLSAKMLLSKGLSIIPTCPFTTGLNWMRPMNKKVPWRWTSNRWLKRVILENFALPGVLVNEKYEIIHFMGKTDKYLETPVGKASFNILSMAREGLRIKLSTALHNAVRQKGTTTYNSLRIKYNGEFRIVDLTVRPLGRNPPTAVFIWSCLRIKHLLKRLRRKREKTAIGESDPVVVSLERELESTKEYLQTTIEELETSNEELKSTNEELQSINEELQSTNEELETSKEELQSTNEELVTVNTELQNKVDELSQANNDINNLLAALEIGTIFLDTDLSIKRFTPAATNIFNLIQTDLSRPISDITSKIRYEHLKKDSQEVLDTLMVREAEVQDTDHNWYSVRISPYRTIDNVIDGVVITFVDITKIKRAEMALRESESNRRLAAVVKDSNDAITVQDFEGNIITPGTKVPKRCMDTARTRP